MKDNTSSTFIGKFATLREIKSRAPRNVGNVACTENLIVCFDGHHWIIQVIYDILTFRVLDRGYNPGRGYYTIIDNGDEINLTTDNKVHINEDKDLDIKGIERLTLLTDPPRIDPKQSIITSEPTEGDIIQII